MADKVRPAISRGEEINFAKKLGASDKQAKEIADKRMADPKAVPGAGSEEDKKMKEWWKTAKPGDYYTSGKGPGNIHEDAKAREKSQAAPRTDTTIKTPIVNAGGMALKTPVGTQDGHAVTTSKNFTKKSK